jgi:NADPH:quinone reductase-like Zn-dependent oxidoreductase
MCPRYSVLGYFNDGGNAEYVAALRENILPIPEPEEGDALTHDEAASLPLVFLTAWHMLVGRSHIKPGDTVLVLGGGSGVGSAAIQIGKMFGARVIATAGDENKLEQARDLGADHVINHYQQKISDEVKKITNKGMCDIVFEHVGKATWMESMKSLKPGGSLVTCGATTGPEASFDIRFLFGRQLSFLGSFMGTMGEFHEVMKHVFSGKLKPVVDRSFPLREAAAAHQRLENGEQFGKVILNP